MSKGGYMNFLRKLGLAIFAIAFCLGIFAATSSAQYGRDRGYQQRGDNWERVSQARRWRNRNYRSGGGISPYEYRRLQRQRERLYNSRSRYYRNDGRLSNWERRRLQNRYYRYRRNVYRDRRDW